MVPALVLEPPLIDELETLLAEERAAIRSLDGTRVLQFARRKQEIVGRLHARRAELTPEEARRFRALAPAIRHNGILLAHARNVLRDTVAAIAGRSGAAGPPASPVPRAKLLSVRG